MEFKIFDRTITLWDFFKIFFKRLWIIILVAIVCCGGFLGILQLGQGLAVGEDWEATAVIRIKQNDFAETLANDIVAIIDSSNVLEECYEKLSLKSKEGKEVSFNEFENQVSVERPKDTQMVVIRVYWDNAETSREIAIKICSQTQDAAKGVLSEAEYELLQIDSNIKPHRRESSSIFDNIKIAAIVGAGAAVVTYLVFVCVFLFDKKVRKYDLLERNIGIPVLGTIPNADGADKSAHDHYGMILSEKIKQQNLSEENK